MGVLQWVLVLSLIQTISTQDVCLPNGCTVSDVALLPATESSVTSHYYIGGMFGMHYEGSSPYECGNVRLRGLLNAEAFFWAIKRYQDRRQLTVGQDPVSVGGFVLDSCSRSERAIENLYSFDTCRIQFPDVSPRNTIAFVGPDTSTEALEVLHLMEDMERTQVAHSATSPALSNDMYKYFLRTVPSSANEAHVMVKVLENQGYKYVQAIYEDTAYGMGIFHEFQNKAEEMDICITNYYAIMMNNLTETVRRVRMNDDTKVVVVFAVHDSARKVLQAFNNANDNSYLFVGTSSWGNSEAVIDGLFVAEKAITMKLDTGSYSNAQDVSQFYDAFRNMKPADNTHNPAFKQFWEEKFGCSLSGGSCDVANQNLADIGEDPYVPFTLMAVDAIISGTKDASMEYCNGIHLCSEMLNRELSRGLKIWEAIVNAKDYNGRAYFNDDGEADPRFARYQVFQVRQGEYKHVVDYNELGLTNEGVPATKVTSKCQEDPCLMCGEMPATGEPDSTTAASTTKKTPTVTIDPQMAMQMLIERYFKSGQEFTGVWRENQTREDNDSKTRFEIGHEWIIAIGVLAGLGIVCVLVFEIYILYKLMGTKIGKQWRTMWLGQLLLFGLFLCYLVLIAYIFTPTKATCGITRFGVGVSYAVCFAVLLVKLMVLLTSKSSADNLIPGDVESPNYLRGIYQFLMFIFVVGVQVVIAVMWLIFVPPDAVQVKSNSGELVWICNHYTWNLHDGWSDMDKFVRTNFENHLISLTYIMVLILITSVVAMKAHGIITNHRESIFIGIAAGFSIPVWVAWGLVGGLNKDHEFAQEFGDASIAFGLFITATLIMFSMFLPKVRQLVNMGVEGIYLEDDRETYYAGSVIMAPPSYKSRPSSVVYVNSNGYNEPVIIGDQHSVHLKHPGSNYSAPVYVKRPESTIGGHSGKVLRMTGDLTGKHPRDSKKQMSEIGYAYAGSGYGGSTYKKPSSERGGTLKRARSAQDIGAL